MAWIPRYKSSGLCSPLIPNGDLSGLIRLCGQYGNLFDVSNGISGNYSSSQDDPGGLHSWEGAFGFNIYNALISKLKSEARSGGATHTNITIAEVEVKKPSGAQYYKQTIAVVGEYSIGPEQTSHGYHGDDAFVLKWAGGNFSIIKVVRREYSTPYSQYTSTDLIVQTLGQNFAIVTQGYNDYWIENRESFLTKLYFSMSFATYNNVKYFCWALYSELQNQADYDAPKKKGCGGIISGLTETHLDTVYDDFEPDEQEDPNEDPDEPPGPGGEEDGGGGGEGGHELPDQPIPIPDLPVIGPADITWLTVYKMTGPQLSEFGQEMLEARLWDAIKQFFNNPLDAIVNIILCPVDVPSSRSKTPEVGRGALAQQWTNAYPVIQSQYVSVNCGSIQFLPYWDSAFDFDPYTKISIFLPFIGYKPLKVDEVMGCGVNVIYHIDVCTGDCIAFISRIPFDDDAYGPYQPQLIAQYQGNCGVRVPIGRLSADAAIDASLRLMAQGLGLAGDIAGSAIGGNNLSDPSSVSMSQVGNQLASATMTAVNGMKQHIERSGALGGNPGYMGKLRPYIIREIPRQILPKPNKDHYWKLEGYPANIGATLGYVVGSGLQQVEAIELDGLPAYDSEITEIESILKGGVIV